MSVRSLYGAAIGIAVALCLALVLDADAMLVIGWAVTPTALIASVIRWCTLRGPGRQISI